MGKKLTIAMLGLAPKGARGDMGDDAESDEEMGESEEETPPGLVEAMGELRAAWADEDDEAAAKAFHRAMQCCE